MEREPLLVSQGSDGVTRRLARGDDFHLTPYDYPQCVIGREYMSERTERRHSSSAVARIFLFSITCVVCLLLMYIPVYNKVNNKLVTVSGWTEETNRDPKVYVQPGNITLVHDIKNICKPSEKEPIFLIIIVCSSTVNFQARQVIRETWGSYDNYLAMYKAWDTVREKYKHYKFDYDLNVETDINSNQTDSHDVTNVNNASNKVNLETAKNTSILRKTRDTDVEQLSKIVRESLKKSDAKISDAKLVGNSNNESHNTAFRNRRSLRNLADMLPQLVAVLKQNTIKQDDNTIDKEAVKNEPTEEVRFPESAEQKQSEFDIDKVLAGDDSEEFEPIDYEESNVMKIPPRGMEDTPDLVKILALLKRTDVFKHEETVKDNKIDSNKLKVEKPTFKVVFLLGLPAGENETEVQSEIDEEAARYGDIIQESFVDSYNNLTLKSIMMLKWLVTHCDKGVRYVLKADDDVFVNVPRLVDTIQQRSSNATTITTTQKQQEYYIMGYLIRNARPISDVRSKWYAPQYMYAGRIYPRYLSGTGYLMTSSAAKSLYRAALTTPLFHLEDIFITGMCAARATPRLQPQAGEGFAYSAPRGWSACDAYSRLTLHRVYGESERSAVAMLSNVRHVDRCERVLLQKKRNEKIKRDSVYTVSGIKNKISKLSHLRNIFF